MTPTNTPPLSRSILIVGPAWIGDMVMSHSLVQWLRRHDTTVNVDILAPAWSAPIVQRMPGVRHCITLASGHGDFHLRERYRLGRHLRANHYAQAIILPRSFKSALVPFFGRIQQRTGYRGEARYGLINDMRTLKDWRALPTVQRYLALGLAPGESLPRLPEQAAYPVLRTDATRGTRILQRLGVAGETLVAMAPGAEYGPAKQWPVGHFAQLAKRLTLQGARVCLFGSQKDQAVAQRIQHQADSAQVYNLCGQTSLDEVCDTLAACAVLITNDSGLMHVGAACGTPIVALYGSSSPQYTPPLTAQASIHYLGLSCSPCFARHCRYGHTNCLTQIEVDVVMESALNAMG